MELKHPIFILIGILSILCISVVYLIKKRKRKEYAGGIKVASAVYLKEDSYYKRKKRIYRLYRGMLLLSICTAIMAAFMLLARPHRVKKITDERYCRDIILCLDVSTSVDYLNKNLVEQLKNTVENLKGERFGIIIFNTSPVLVSPLTDDYEYIIEQLDNIEKGLKNRIDAGKSGDFQEDYLYWDQYISSGTLVGNEERGSSLVGDGLASSVFHFSMDEKDRPRIVIFATDNDVYGEQIVALPEAAELCKKRNVVVYGVGTKEMYETDLQEMKLAVEATGGQFYLEEESGTFKKIVENIEAKSEGLVKGNTFVTEVDYPRIPFILLVISCTIMYVVSKKLRL